LPSSEKAHLKVVGMYCTTCKPIVENQLRNNKGIKKIDINYMTDSVVVEFDPILTNIKEIKASLEKSGYTFVRVPRF
jgi:Cu+-exporting ATPase